MLFTSEFGCHWYHVSFLGSHGCMCPYKSIKFWCYQKWSYHCFHVTCSKPDVIWSSNFKVLPWTQAICRGRSGTTATSKMENFAVIIYDWKPLIIITKSSILDDAAVLDPSLIWVFEKSVFHGTKHEVFH